MKPLRLLSVFVLLAVSLFAQTDIGPVHIPGGTIDNTTIGATTPSTGVFTTLNNVVMADAQVGTDMCTKLTTALALLPAGGGTVDARGLQGAQACDATVTVSRRAKILLGAVTLTGPSTGDIFNVTQQSVEIIGLGKNITVLKPVTAGQSNGIHFSTTNNAHTYYRVADLAIIDSSNGAGRRGGAGILVDAPAPPGQNSIGLIDNVLVQYMFQGVVLNRPITTTLLRVDAYNSGQDGFVLQGDGTSVSLINTYAKQSGQYNYHQLGMDYVSYYNTASDSATSDGYHIERQSGVSGAQALATAMINPGAESNGGKGLYVLDCDGLTITSPRITANTGDGIHLDGCRDVPITGGYVSANARCGIRVTQSATPVFPATITNINTTFTGNTGGNECLIAVGAYDSFGYVGATNYVLNRPLQLGEEAAPTGVTSYDILWGGTGHRLMMNNNDAGAITVAGVFLGSRTLTYTAIAGQACEEQTLTVTGATTTGTASASPTASLGNANLSWSAWVSAADTVSVRVCNVTAGSITPSAVTWNASVVR